MSEPNPELEPDVPDWSNEPKSDDLLAEQLQERGLNVSEVVDPAPADVPEDAPEPSPAVPAPDTSPPEEREGEAGEGEEGNDGEDDVA